MPASVPTLLAVSPLLLFENEGVSVLMGGADDSSYR